jgi:hypothetical protein
MAEHRGWSRGVKKTHPLVCVLATSPAHPLVCVLTTSPAPSYLARGIFWWGSGQAGLLNEQS